VRDTLDTVKQSENTGNKLGISGDWLERNHLMPDTQIKIRTRIASRNDLLLAGFSLALGMLAGEAGARWFLPHLYRMPDGRRSRADLQPMSAPIVVKDPEIGWVLSSTPVKSRHRFIGKDGSVHYDVVYSVKDGRRDTSVLPHSGSVVIATGCSFTFGHGVNDQDSWPWLLQNRLAGSQVINVAAMAYGTDQALLAAERQVERLHGQVRTVVLGFLGAQIERNRSAQSWLWTIYPFEKPLFAVNGENVQNRGLVKFWTLGKTLDRSALAAHILRILSDRVFYRVEEHDGSRRLTAALIREFGNRFRARGIKLVVIVLPYMEDQGPEQKEDQRFIIEQLRAANLTTLVPQFPRQTDGTLDAHRFMASTVDTHPGREYNVVIAGQLVQTLQ
jgi:hypothetical protein